MDLKITNTIIYIMGIGVYVNLFFYFNDANILPLPEYTSYLFLSMYMVAYYLIFRVKIYLSKELLTWVVFYFFINSLYLLVAGFASKEYLYFGSVLMGVFVFFSLSLLYNLDDNKLLVTRKSVLIGTLIGTISLILHFLIPDLFFSNDSTAVAGRAIATYGNSNVAGTVMVLGMILSIDVVNSKLKTLYILFVFLGILATFSRSGMLVFLLITSIMAYQNKISKKTFVIMLASLVSFMLFLLLGGLDLIAEAFNIEITDNLINRISFFVDSDNSETGDMNERKEVLLAALNLFADSPYFGDGFAATRLWDHRVSPHNTFAIALAEFGLIGLLIISTFLYSATHGVFKCHIKEYRDTGVLFIVYYISYSMFSHNMMYFPFNIAAAVLIATLGYKNRHSKEVK